MGGRTNSLPLSLTLDDTHRIESNIVLDLGEFCFVYRSLRGNGQNRMSRKIQEKFRTLRISHLFSMQPPHLERRRLTPGVDLLKHNISCPLKHTFSLSQSL